MSKRILNQSGGLTRGGSSHIGEQIQINMQQLFCDVVREVVSLVFYVLRYFMDHEPGIHMSLNPLVIPRQRADSNLHDRTLDGFYTELHKSLCRCALCWFTIVLLLNRKLNIWAWRNSCSSSHRRQSRLESSHFFLKCLLFRPLADSEGHTCVW